jgi:hypothetical protein
MKVLVLTTEPITAAQLRDALRTDTDPAIEDALQTFGADRIVLFAHEGEARRYREEVDPVELTERLGGPVD